MNTDIKELIGTKFLFNENLISYESLVKLLENKGLNTDFIQKPIKDKLEVHSLYIKPDFEVAFLAKSVHSDNYYRTACYGCVEYKEIYLYDVLKFIGYLNIQSQKDTQKEKKPKKSKFWTLTNEKGEFTFRKNKIRMFLYKESELIIRYYKDTFYFNMNKEMYKELKRELKF